MSLARAGLRFVDWLVPKNESSVMCGVPTGDDQIREMIQAWSPHTVAITVLVPSGRGFSCYGVEDSSKIRFVRKNTARGIASYLRARYVFFTHGLYANPKPPKRKLVVNLWHGNPVKKVGLDAGEGRIDSTAAITSSPDYVPVLGRSFGIGEHRVWVTGLPRTDAMVRAAAGSQRPRPILTVLWLPTFRDWELGSLLTVKDLVHLEGADAASLDEMFSGLNMRAIVRAHPLLGRVQEYESAALKVARGDVAHAPRLSVLLADADVLITDISSVWQEFLILDRPIIFASSDLAAVRRARGHYDVDAQWIGRAGPLVTTFDELRSVLQDFANGSDPWRATREEARNRLHAHVDGASSYRVVAQVNSWREEVLGRQWGRGALARRPSRFGA